MDIKLIPLTEDNSQNWNEFCQASDDAWFWHTTDWLNYTRRYKPELKTQNLSFLAYKQDKIIAVVPLTVEIYRKEGDTTREFSFGGAAVPAPVLSNDLDRIEKDLVYNIIFTEIDRLAKENWVKRICMRQSPLAGSFLNKKFSFNYLMKYDYIDTSLNTQLIDLNKSEDELWKDLRRNHQRNIKKGNMFKTIIFTAENTTKDIFAAYKNMHHRAAGRQTRPDETFDLMYEWLARGLAFLVVVEFENKFIGFEYYSVYKNNVYGFSAANDPDCERDFPIRHLLEWEAILWMKEQKFDFYEIGLQQFGILPYNFPDQKQLNISHFKKGFGGFTVPWFMGEKYYDKDYFDLIYQDRVRQYGEKYFIKKDEDYQC